MRKNPLLIGTICLGLAGSGLLIDAARKHIYARRYEQEEQSIRALLSEGDKMYDSGKLENAINLYQRAWSSPHHPPNAAAALAQLFFLRQDTEQVKNWSQNLEGQKDWSAWLEDFRTMSKSETDPQGENFHLITACAPLSEANDANLKLILGKEARDASQLKSALEIHEAGLAVTPRCLRLVRERALDLLAIKGKESAYEYLEEKLNGRRPIESSLLTSVAVIALKVGDRQKAKQNLQNAIRTNSQDCDAFLLLGDLTNDPEEQKRSDYNSNRDSYGNRCASYEMVTKLCPNYPIVYKKVADIYFDIRDMGAAAKNYRRLIELSPKYPEIRVRLAQISRNGGDGVEAEKLLRQELALYPKSKTALAELGSIQMSKREFPVAQITYEELLGIDEDNAEAHFGLGVISHLQGEYEGALRHLDRVIAIDRMEAKRATKEQAAHVDAYWQEGLIFQKMKKLKLARQAFENYKLHVREPASISKADAKLQELKKMR